VIGITDLTPFAALYKAILTLFKEQSLLDKCSNPACGDSFRYLQHGNLFRLEGDPNANSLLPKKKPEYFWLCRTCAGDMTLRLDDGASVRTIRVPDSLEPTESSVDFVPLDRRKGPVLSCLHFLGRRSQQNWIPSIRGKLSFAR
jgi:hypothetical protein